MITTGSCFALWAESIRGKTRAPDPRGLLMIKSLQLYPNDPKQAVRMRRFYMAASTSVLVVFLIFLCNWLGFVSNKVLGVASGIILLILAVFYVLF